MTRDEYEIVTSLVMELWSTSRITLERLGAMYPRFRGLGLADVQHALRKHCCNEPDNTRPNWGTVFASLGRDESKPRRHEFRILLDNVRRGNREHGSDHWSDGETFAFHLKLQTHSTLTNAVTKEPRPDTDGRLALTAKRWRDAEYGMWQQYLTDIGEPVPDFLKEPV